MYVRDGIRVSPKGGLRAVLCDVVLIHLFSVSSSLKNGNFDNTELKTEGKVWTHCTLHFFHTYI